VGVLRQPFGVGGEDLNAQFTPHTMRPQYSTDG
jgi:hypothetical protein